MKLIQFFLKKPIHNEAMAFTKYWQQFFSKPQKKMFPMVVNGITIRHLLNQPTAAGEIIENKNIFVVWLNYE